MRASLQNDIAPPKVVNTESMSDAKVSRQADAIDSTGPKDEIDFKSVLFNSNMDTRKVREAKKNGDLSSESQEEFLEKLADQTRQKRVPKNKLGKDDFLKLFVTQLQHQDPLNPDDGAEMAAKLAQFNSLEQLMNVNKGIEKMAEAESTNRSMMLSGFIGQDIEVTGGRFKLDGKDVSDARYELKTGAKNASLQIRDTNGILVKEMDLGSLPPGKHKFTWDGHNTKGEKAANGVYTYSLMALDADGKDIPVSISSRVKITGVDINDPAGALYTDFGRVPLESVQAVGEKGFFRYDRDQLRDSSQAPGTEIPVAPPQTTSTQQASAPQAPQGAAGEQNAKPQDEKVAEANPEQSPNDGQQQGSQKAPEANPEVQPKEDAAVTQKAPTESRRLNKSIDS